MSEGLKLLDALEKERAVLSSQTDPLRAARDAIIAEIQPKEDEARALAAQIRDINGERAFELDMEISKLSKVYRPNKLQSGQQDAEDSAKAE